MRTVVKTPTVQLSGVRHKAPKEVSLTDPQATWAARPGLDQFFAFDTNYLIDNKAGIILGAVGTQRLLAEEVYSISLTKLCGTSQFVATGNDQLQANTPRLMANTSSEGGCAGPSAGWLASCPMQLRPCPSGRRVTMQIDCLKPSEAPRKSRVE
jgi:hypothetical protein